MKLKVCSHSFNQEGLTKRVLCVCVCVIRARSMSKVSWCSWLSGQFRATPFLVILQFLPLSKRQKLTLSLGKLMCEKKSHARQTQTYSLYWLHEPLISFCFVPRQIWSRLGFFSKILTQHKDFQSHPPSHLTVTLCPSLSLYLSFLTPPLINIRYSITCS